MLSRQPEEAAQVSQAREGAVPGRPREAVRGEIVKAMTWYCPEKDRAARKTPAASAESGPSARAFISQGAKPLFRLEATGVQPAGECWGAIDTIETAYLEPGRYVYHLRWTERTGGEVEKEATPQPMDAEASFEIVAPRPPEAVTFPASVPGRK